MNAQSSTKRHDIPKGALRALRGRKGSLLLEAIIAIGIFGIFLSGIGAVLLAGQRSSIIAGDRMRATLIAERQIAGVRALACRSFDSLSAGTYGMSETATGWTLISTPIDTNGYIASITLSLAETDRWNIASTVSWNFGMNRSGSTVLESSVTNWKKAAAIGNWAAMTLQKRTTIEDGITLERIAVSEHFAYITSQSVAGGNGLYIVDVSNPALPVRVASSFDLGASAYGLAVTDDRLYVLTDNASAELQVFDVSSPASLTLADQINAYDLPGSGLGRSVAVYGSTVFIGTLEDPAQQNFYALQMSETGPMALLDTLSTTGSILKIALKDGYAYTTNSNNAAELVVIDVFDPSALTFAPNVGIDLTEVHDTLSLAISGTSALLGRMNGESISELVLYDISASPVPVPPPGPWDQEIGGDAQSLSIIPGSHYAFVAGTSDGGQVRSISLTALAQNQASMLQSIDVGSPVPSIAYDAETDRLFGITSTELLTLAPG